MSKKTNQLKIVIYGYDITTLEEVVRMFTEQLVQVKANFTWPFPLPTKKRLITVPISPHKYKDAQEQFIQEIYRRVIFLAQPSARDIEDLNKIKLPNTIGVKWVMKN